MHERTGERFDIRDHITDTWDALTRTAEHPHSDGSALALPRPFVVPGGRFAELYYWDSYFTLLGLAEDGRFDLVESMVENFAYLIRTYGHIPNGTRSYMLTRSNQPFFPSW